MVRYACHNVKNNIQSRYFLLGILLVSSIFFFTEGQGGISYNIREKPIILFEIFRYSVEQYEKNIMDYSAASMFLYGMRRYMYLVMPLTGIAQLIQFCDEKHGGNDFLIQIRIGKQKYLAGTLASSAMMAVLTVLGSAGFILAILYGALPDGIGKKGVPGLDDCLRIAGFACVLAVLGSWMGLLIAVLIERKIVALVLSVLMFETWTEMCAGVKIGNPIFFLNLRTLMNPLKNGTPLLMYIGFVLIGMVLMSGGFYLLASKRMERGKC